MSEKHKIELYLNGPQKSKFVKKLPFQLTAKQCGSKDGKHRVSALLSQKDYKDFLKKVSKNKGMRFSKDSFLEGSGLFKDLMKGAIKTIAPKVIDEIGDRTGTRNMTDSLIKPNSDKIIDIIAGSSVGIEINEMKPAVMPSKSKIRIPEYKLAVMPNEIVGKSVKKGRFVKGSIEAKEWMASIRKGRRTKLGGNVFDDIGRKLKDTFNPDLGRKIKDALTSDTAKKIYKEVSNVAIPLIAASTGNPMLGQVAKIGIDSALGSGLKKKRCPTNIKSINSTLLNGVPQLIQSRTGGSFKTL